MRGKRGKAVTGISIERKKGKAVIVELGGELREREKKWLIETR